MNEKYLIGGAAILSIIVSIIALKNYSKTAGATGGNALRNSNYGQFTTPAVTWNANDQSNINGMSAYARRPDLDPSNPRRIWTGKLGAGQTIPDAGIGGPTGYLQGAEWRTLHRTAS